VKILLVHNSYQHKGGEDSVLASEKKLLTKHNNLVQLSIVTNKSVQNIFSKLDVAINTTWSQPGYKHITLAIKQFEPNVIHVHNFFPLLTPSVYDAAIKMEIPLVQTLHNYRTICPGALLMRNGKICEKCITSSPYHAIRHRCYRNSILGSWAVARMVAHHRNKLTWQNKVDCFIALTRFGKQKFVEAGFPAKKIVVKPNFYEISKDWSEISRRRMGALFVGRVSEEKGVTVMLKAWHGLGISLRVAGSGPMLHDLQRKHESCIEFLGQMTREQISKEMAQAAFLVMPSEWYETFGLVIVEAYAHGIPVIASRLGAMAEIVENGVTGLHFEAGNAEDLSQKVQWLHDHPEECRRMGKNARRVYEEKYTPEKNYEMLMDVYKQAIASKKNLGNGTGKGNESAT
jgi:glycosyltransferase involved in cell wall biosynthesis